MDSYWTADRELARQVAVMPAGDGAVLLQVSDLQIQAVDRRDDAIAPTPWATAKYPYADVMGHMAVAVGAAIGRVIRVDGIGGRHVAAVSRSFSRQLCWGISSYRHAGTFRRGTACADPACRHRAVQAGSSIGTTPRAGRGWRPAADGLSAETLDLGPVCLAFGHTGPAFRSIDERSVFARRRMSSSYL